MGREINSPFPLGDMMPKGYEKMRDKFKSEGLNDKAAKTKAAKIWNSRHKDNPVGRYDGASKSKGGYSRKK